MNDIALIKLSEDIDFNESTQPACLGTQTVYQYKNFLQPAGWGSYKVLRENRFGGSIKKITELFYCFILNSQILNFFSLNW